MNEISNVNNSDKLTKGDEIIILANKLQDAMKVKWNEATLNRITRQGENIIALAESTRIKTDDDYKAANDLLIRINQYSKEGEAYCEPFKKAAYGPYATVLDIAKKIEDSRDKAVKLINNELRKWRDLQEKKRLEEQRKADEERRKREEAQRARLERKAEKALEKGDDEKAEELLDAAENAFVPPTVVEKTIAKTETADSGRVTFVKDWDVEVANVMDVLKAIVAGDLPETFAKIEMSSVKKWARAMDIKRYNKNGLVIVQTERPATRWNKG